MAVVVGDDQALHAGSCRSVHGDASGEELLQAERDWVCEEVGGVCESWPLLVFGGGVQEQGEHFLLVSAAE